MKDLREYQKQVHSSKILAQKYKLEIMKLRQDKRSLKKSIEKSQSELDKLNNSIVRTAKAIANLDRLEGLRGIATLTELVIDVAVSSFGVNRELLHTDKRYQELVFARNAIWFYLRTHHNMPFQKMGDLFSRGHATVIVGIRKFELDYVADPDYGAKYDAMSIILQEAEKQFLK